MYDMKKILIFIFVTILIVYMIRLSIFTKKRGEFKTNTFKGLLLGLSLILIATFIDILMPLIDNNSVYMFMKGCFTLGGIIYIIGLIHWIDYTRKFIQKLEDMSFKDSMLDVYNRKGLSKIYDMLMSTEDIFYILFCDLDDLKKINDTYGHSQGDTYIMNATKTIVDVVGDTGYVARLGGDEFVVILKFKDIDEIHHIISHIKDLILKISPSKQTSISIGYAQFPKDSVSLDILLNIADKRMYVDKQNSKKDMS